MIARGKETKEHEDFKLLSKRGVFSCVFLVVTGAARPRFCCRGICDFRSTRGGGAAGAGDG